MASGRQLNSPRRSGRNRGASEEELSAQYERYWESELPSDPRNALVGLGIAFAVAVSIMLFPWMVAWLQDEGFIKPQLHLQLIPTSSHFESPPAQPQQEPQPASYPTHARFGSPRQ